MAASIVEEIIEQLNPQVSDQLSDSFPVNKDQAKGVLPLITPLILGALKRQFEHGGDDEVEQTLNQYGEKRYIKDVPAAVKERADATDEDVDFGGLLQGVGGDAIRLLADKLNIDSGTATQMLVAVVPLIISYLTAKRDGEAPAGASGVGGNETGQAVIRMILDKDGDGSVLDDVGGMVLRHLQKSLGGGESAPRQASTKSKPAAQDDLLGSILRGILSGR